MGNCNKKPKHSPYAVRNVLVSKDSFSFISSKYPNIGELRRGFRSTGFDSVNVTIGIDFTERNRLNGPHGINLHDIVYPKAEVNICGYLYYQQFCGIVDRQSFKSPMF